MTESSKPVRRARRERADGNTLEAGELYTSAAFRKAGITPLRLSSGGELKHFLEAATCYRIAGRMDRARNRCRTGILRAEDLAERAMALPDAEHDIHQADRGGWYEAIGMCRLVGDLDGVDEAYDRAFEIYEAAGDPADHRTEHPRATLYEGWFASIERAVTGEVTQITARQEYTYTEFASHVRERIPEYIAALEEMGEWPGGDDAWGDQ